jgi:FG-GAP-like repeat
MPVAHRIRFVRGAAKLLALVTTASCSPQDSVAPRKGGTANFAPATTIEREPILTVGHGVAFLADGSAVEKPTSEFIRGAQRYYIESLADQATPEVRAQFERMREAQTGSVSTEFRDNHEAIRWLLERVKPANQAGLGSINAYLLDKSGAKDARSEIGVSKQALQLTTSNSGAEYMKECEARGVPKPPDWNSAEWKWRGKLKSTFLTQFSNLSTNVYTYEPPTGGGICFALPRTGPGTDPRNGEYSENLINLLGVICQSNETSNACFWDLMYITPPKPTERYPIASVFLGGTEVTDVCTDCHRGENAFIIHPETPLDIGDALLKPKGWMRPLVRASFPKNPRPGHDFSLVKTKAAKDLEKNERDLSCTSCHNKKDGRRLPPIDLKYCTVLQQAVGTKGTMPAATEEEAAKAKEEDQNLSEAEKDKKQLERLELRKQNYTTHLAWIADMCSELRRQGDVPKQARRFEAAWAASDAVVAERALFGDFNGDGRSDYLYVDGDNAVQVSLANASGFDASKRRPYELPEGALPVAAGDFDGDGLDDLLVAPTNGGEVLVGFVSSPDLERCNVQLEADSRVFVGDVNNDRLDDLVTVSAGARATVQIHLSNKLAFEPGASVVLDLSADAAEVLAGDVDGDYLLDLVFLSKDGRSATLAIGTGRGFETSSVGGDLFGGLTPKQMHLADVDADGLEDLIAVAQDGTFAVAKSSGRSFAFEAWRGGVVGTRTFLADVNADGRADLVALGSDGSLKVGLSKE